MGRCRVEVSYGRLADLLGLPQGSRVYGVRGSPDSFGATGFEVFCEHPGLPTVVEDGLPPVAHLVVACEADGSAVFVKWGLPGD